MARLSSEKVPRDTSEYITRGTKITGAVFIQSLQVLKNTMLRKMAQDYNSRHMFGTITPYIRQWDDGP